MNDNAIKNYAIWARRELMAEVEKRCTWWGIPEDKKPRADLDTIDGRVLSAQERKQRAALQQIVQSEGYAQLVERAAYTWFNRLLAIRFMELNDRLPSHVRMLSSIDGSFEPQCLREAMDLPLKALDKEEVVRLVQSGDDEALFRLVFLAQCAELADCMPAVFEPVGSAMELLLPTGLLRTDSVVGKLVNDIPEEDWREGVEIVGWMYQYYVSERKDEVFASFKKGKKAERDAIAPATQLFTPHWIVRYLTENSLGRLWMLNHPDSSLVDRMSYYVKPDEEHETEFRHIESPEEITCVDPACGSGHILVYAFDLLAAMYEESGYSNRDAARSILKKNLTGLEIDARAAAMASFALTMKACELDSRFLRRGVVPNVVVLNRVEFTPEELALCKNVAGRKQLVDAAAHLDECGSLFQSDAGDLAAIERDLASLANDESLFAGSAREKLVLLRAELVSLAEQYDVVVANPPYMGGKNMNRWLGAWVKRNYADVKGDLFSCFMVRNVLLGFKHAQLGFMTPYVWMFIGTYEKLRRFVIEQNTITSLIQLEYSGFAGATVPICTFTLQKGCQDAYEGGYIRLSDFPGAENQAPRVLEALADPQCGWFYRRDASTFEAIPGYPIAYWTSTKAIDAFQSGKRIKEFGQTTKGIVTADNDRFLRLWWECGLAKESFTTVSHKELYTRKEKWFPISKGGQFRKWYGNNLYVVNWKNRGEDIFLSAKKTGKHPQDYDDRLKFLPGITWSAISSSYASFRYIKRQLCEGKGLGFFPDNKLEILLGACNSHVIREYLRIMAPTLDFNVGTIDLLPILTESKSEASTSIVPLVNSTIGISQLDWDSYEISWDFKRSPLV